MLEYLALYEAQRQVMVFTRGVHPDRPALPAPRQHWTRRERRHGWRYITAALRRPARCLESMRSGDLAAAHREASGTCVLAALTGFTL